MERDYLHRLWHQRRRRRFFIIFVLTLLVGGTIGYVHSCVQKMSVPDAYEPKDIDRLEQLKERLDREQSGGNR